MLIRGRPPLFPFRFMVGSHREKKTKSKQTREKRNKAGKQRRSFSTEGGWPMMENICMEAAITREFPPGNGTDVALMPNTMAWPLSSEHAGKAVGQSLNTLKPSMRNHLSEKGAGGMHERCAMRCFFLVGLALSSARHDMFAIMLYRVPFMCVCVCE